MELPQTPQFGSLNLCIHPIVKIKPPLKLPLYCKMLGSNVQMSRFTPAAISTISSSVTTSYWLYLGNTWYL
jgi:hypothetical protein